MIYRSSDGVRVRFFLYGTDRVFPVGTGFADYGRFVWSPDSNQIMLIGSPADLDTQTASTFTIMLITLSKNKIETIVANDPRLIYPVEWSDPNRVRFASWDGTAEYLYDLGTKEFTLVE